MTNATFTIHAPYCPLYDAVVHCEPWRATDTAHAGLLFDKFGHAWRTRNDAGKSYPEFDKGDSRTKADAGKWLDSFQRLVGDEKRIEEAAVRHRQLVEKCGGKILLLTNVSRFVTGMGREHPIENGFVWHHTLGVPYLPGSSVKGMLRAWLREAGEFDDAKQQFKEDEAIRRQFGFQEKQHSQAGEFIVFDMLPTQRPQLVVDVMTPHYSDYYQKGKTPGDWHSPIPISFLTVEAGCSWQVGIAPVTLTSPDKSNTDLEQLSAALLEALQFNGAGAKTAVGYGRFERDEAAENNAWAADEKRRQDERDRIAADAAKQAKLQQLAALPPDVAAVVRLADAGSWTTGPAAFMQGLPQFLDQNPTPSAAVVEWLCENILQPHWKAAWANPTGSAAKKLKPKQMELLQRVRKLAGL